MSLFDRILNRNKKDTASKAKERLSILISKNEKIDFMDDMKKDIMAVVNKYVNIDLDDIECDLHKNVDGEEILEMNVILEK